MRIFDRSSQLPTQQWRRLNSENRRWLKNPHNLSEWRSAMLKIRTLNDIDSYLPRASKYYGQSAQGTASWSYNLKTRYRKLESELARALKQMPRGIKKDIQEKSGKYRPKKGGIVEAAFKRS